MRARTIVLVIAWVLALVVGSLAFDQEPKSHWVKYDSGKVRYYDIGNHRSKNVLFFIHGWAGVADFWKESYAAFPNYRVIVIDLPGHGQSDKPKTTYSMEYFARSIEAVMKASKVEKAVLVGHSMGTPVARQFYRLFPEQTIGLVIVDGPLRPFGPKEQMEQFLGPVRANYKENGTKMIDGLLRPIKDDALKKSIRDAMLLTPDHVAISAMYGMADDAIWTVDQVKVPVLAVMAADGPWPPDTKDFYKTIAPNLEYVVIQDVSHFLFMEKPKQFNEDVASFIAKNKLL